MTTNEIVPTSLPDTFVVPSTGEILDVSNAEQMAIVAASEPEVLGLMLETIDAHVRDAQDARAYVAGFLIDRMDRDATQTLHAGDYTLTVNGSSDEYETYDADALYASLSLLVGEGIITQAAADKAVKVKREASKSGLNSLRALRNDAIDAAVEAARGMAQRRRRVSVKRAR
jgi:hypothetical protein